MIIRDLALHNKKNRPMKNIIRKIIKVRSIISNLRYFGNHNVNNRIGNNVKISSPFKIVNTEIGDYSYIASNSSISNTTIGKFCSIGLNLISGCGIHPTNGISTSPMFYSINKQNGITLCSENKIVERKNITIGNDVFIGDNVTILDGITIGDGAVIGAGAVVSKNIPSYAIAVGIPIKIIKYRFTDLQIKELLEIKWWNFSLEKLKHVEENFFSIDLFIKRTSEF